MDVGSRVKIYNGMPKARISIRTKKPASNRRNGNELRMPKKKLWLVRWGCLYPKRLKPERMPI